MARYLDLSLMLMTYRLKQCNVMARYLDPKTDLTFKRIFCEHKHLLISFLAALLPLKCGEEIVV